MDNAIETLQAIARVRAGDTFSFSCLSPIPKTSWGSTIYKNAHGENRETMLSQLEGLCTRLESYTYSITDFRNATLVSAIEGSIPALHILANNYRDDQNVVSRLIAITQRLLLVKHKVFNSYVDGVEIIVSLKRQPSQKPSQTIETGVENKGESSLFDSQKPSQSSGREEREPSQSTKSKEDYQRFIEYMRQLLDHDVPDTEADVHKEDSHH